MAGKCFSSKLHSQLLQVRRLALKGFEGLVAWDSMTSMDVNVGDEVIIKNVINIPVLITADHWVWRTTIPPSTGFYPPHKHDFV